MIKGINSSSRKLNLN